MGRIEKKRHMFVNRAAILTMQAIHPRGFSQEMNCLVLVTRSLYCWVGRGYGRTITVPTMPR
jgi:hypothetical protein